MSRHWRPYVLAFAEKPAEANLLVSLLGRGDTRVHLLTQGGARVDKGDFQVIKMRTDLLAPRPGVGLARQTTYPAGGTDFGPAVPPSAAGGLPPGSEPPSYPPAQFGEYVGPDIISRNLTPDKNGLPEGGNTLEQFKEILRKGTDFDHLNPTCTAALPSPTPANCIPPPVDGNLLQGMPWQVFHNMTDHQIEAIYGYLSAIPCIEGPAQPSDLPTPLQYAFPVLHNDCGDPKPANQQRGAVARGARP